jgi:hypothetical protein
LRNGTLWIVRGIDLEFLAVPTFKLKSVLECEFVAAVLDWPQESKSPVPTRAAVGSDAVVAETQSVPLIVNVDGQVTRAAVARLRDDRNRLSSRGWRLDANITFIGYEVGFWRALVDVGEKLRPRPDEVRMADYTAVGVEQSQCALHNGSENYCNDWL